MIDASSAKEILAQNPYNPVCLMTEIVAGTQYEQTLDLFRRFRDDFLVGKAGSTGSFMLDFYYDYSRILAPYVRKSGITRRISLSPYRIIYKLFSFLGRKGFF